MVGRKNLYVFLGIFLLGAVAPSIALASVPRVVIAEDFGSPG